jgi:hypothetical protein
VPPPDPLSSPALDRALPEDADPRGEYREVPRGSTALVLFGDGKEYLVDLREWQRDKRGRWRCHLEWYDGTTTRGGWFVYDAGKIREAAGGLGGVTATLTATANLVSNEHERAGVLNAQVVGTAD